MEWSGLNPLSVSLSVVSLSEVGTTRIVPGWTVSVTGTAVRFRYQDIVLDKDIIKIRGTFI